MNRAAVEGEEGSAIACRSFPWIRRLGEQMMRMMTGGRTSENCGIAFRPSREASLLASHRRFGCSIPGRMRNHNRNFNLPRQCLLLALDRSPDPEASFALVRIFFAPGSKLVCACAIVHRDRHGLRRPARQSRCAGAEHYDAEHLCVTHARSNPCWPPAAFAAYPL